MTLDLLILFILVVLNGFLVMAELAIVAAKRARLKRAVERGSTGARRALKLADDPGRFLSTVQIGITAIGTMMGAFGGQALIGPAAEWLGAIPTVAPYAEHLAIALVVVGLTYATLILGELVPKRLALAHSESLAIAVARPLQLVALAGAPFVWVINASTNLVLALLPKGPAQPDISDEEVRILMTEGAASGHFHEAERAIVEMTLRLGDRRVDALMTPRPQIEWLDVLDPPKLTLEKIVETQHARFPVKKGNSRTILGYVQVKDLFGGLAEGRALDLAAAVKPVTYIPDTTLALKALELFRANGQPLAIIVDEYGDIQGLVTLTDLLEGLVGELDDAESPDEGRSVVQRDDGSYLIDGSFPLDRVWHLVGIPEPRDDDAEDYNTLGGFMMHRLKRIPEAGDHFVLHGNRFEVVDMDGRRVDKVLVAALVRDDEATSG